MVQPTWNKVNSAPHVRQSRTLPPDMSKDKDYKFTPWDGTPGLKFEKFEKDLLLVAAGEVDKRGWSLADHLLTVDEGGADANAPAMPVGNNQDARDAEAGQRKRRKESFTLITYHITDEDLVESLKTDYFQRGLDCYVPGVSGASSFRRFPLFPEFARIVRTRKKWIFSGAASRDF